MKGLRCFVRTYVRMCVYDIRVSVRRYVNFLLGVLG